MIGLDGLRGRGLNLVAVLPIAEARAVAPMLPTDWTAAVLVGSTGGAMWKSLTTRGFLDRDHPVDEHAEEGLRDFVAAVRRAGGRAERAWPSAPGSMEIAPLPITKLGEAAGWGRRSPLGIGMHPRHGLWTGYRGLVLVDGDWTRRVEPHAPHPCDACETRPCVTRCPASAIGATKGIRADPCFAERLRPGAACASACLSRLACPVGDGRYPAAQIAHHQAYGNRVYHRWKAAQG